MLRLFTVLIVLSFAATTAPARASALLHEFESAPNPSLVLIAGKGKPIARPKPKPTPKAQRAVPRKKVAPKTSASGRVLPKRNLASRAKAVQMPKGKVRLSVSKTDRNDMRAARQMSPSVRQLAKKPLTADRAYRVRHALRRMSRNHLSTAKKPDQHVKPKNAVQRALHAKVMANPKAGTVKPKLSNDPAFKKEDGWRKMERSVVVPKSRAARKDGGLAKTKLTAHYQFNKLTGRVADFKFVDMQKHK